MILSNLYNIKSSPAESLADFEPQETSQALDVKLRKALFTDSIGEQVVWLGYGAGKCVGLSRCDDLSPDEPFRELNRVEASSNPMDICRIKPNQFGVGFGDGTLRIINTDKKKIESVAKIKPLHGSCDSRVLSYHDDIITSGSSNGSIVHVDVTTQKVTTYGKFHGAVRSLVSFAGGKLLASGHGTGQIAIWDLRQPPFNSVNSVVPSKKPLDAITALSTHPAMANLVSFGTDDGAIGFCDVRGASGTLVPTSFDVATAAITQIKFDAHSGEHLLCSSEDGSIVHWDVSGIPSTEYLSVGNSRQAAWLAESLSDWVKLSSLRSKCFSAINSIDVNNTTVLATSDIGTLLCYTGLPFPKSHQHR
ncbi:hypothetical protein WR25_23151 [Diploscapter pachys]|uniref:Uncharacterized protein n=1 Tax=Diploscapter pachys TaxID=2018661 RepID=A0A2A2LZS1_9BILA|nr:hypothetical protein WR25_23151 [Diploscapter pachys]